MKRKPKKKPSKEFKDMDVLKPIDLNVIGGKDDPCFGKAYDLKAPECRVQCGDAEFCQMAFNARMKVMRIEAEKKTDFKDLNLNKEEILAYYKKRKKITGSPIKAKQQTTTKYNIGIKTLKKWISEI